MCCAHALQAVTDTVDPAALSEQMRLYHSAVQIGIHLYDRTLEPERDDAHRQADQQDVYLRFTPTGEYHVTTTVPNATSA